MAHSQVEGEQDSRYLRNFSFAWTLRGRRHAGSSPDDSGTKNPVQAIGSTTWYLCRYTFLASAGVAVKGQDTDGITFTAQLEQELRAIRTAPDLSALKMVSTQPIQDYMKSNKLKEAKVLIDARDEAKRISWRTSQHEVPRELPEYPAAVSRMAARALRFGDSFKNRET